MRKLRESAYVKMGAIDDGLATLTRYVYYAVTRLKLPTGVPKLLIILGHQGADWWSGTMRRGVGSVRLAFRSITQADRL